LAAAGASGAGPYTGAAADCVATLFTVCETGWYRFKSAAWTDCPSAISAPATNAFQPNSVAFMTILLTKLEFFLTHCAAPWRPLSPHQAST
jgi:hypothetical protein